jgi:regulator-associated protein of mTOR
MALGDLMASRLVHSSSSSSLSPAAPPAPLPNHLHGKRVTDGLTVANGPEPRNGLEVAEVEMPAPVVYLPQVVLLCEQRHEGLDEAAAATGPSTSGLVSKWRPKDRVMDWMRFSMQNLFVLILLLLDRSLD